MIGCGVAWEFCCFVKVAIGEQAAFVWNAIEVAVFACIGGKVAGVGDAVVVAIDDWPCVGCIGRWIDGRLELARLGLGRQDYRNANADRCELNHLAPASRSRELHGVAATGFIYVINTRGDRPESNLVVNELCCSNEHAIRILHDMAEVSLFPQR